jgi:hypothetical protein
VDVEGSWWRSGGRVDVERECMWREGGGCGGSVDVEVGWMLRMGGGASQTSHVTMVIQSIHASLVRVGRVVDVEEWRKGGYWERMYVEGRWWMWRKCGCGGRLNVEDGW